MDASQIINLLSIGARNLAESRKPKEAPKDEKKEEVKPEPEKKRSGGYVKSADGCAQRGKTKGRMV